MPPYRLPRPYVLLTGALHSTSLSTQDFLPHLQAAGLRQSSGRICLNGWNKTGGKRKQNKTIPQRLRWRIALFIVKKGFVHLREI